MEIAILGAGTMGHGLALAYALGGHTVRVTDTDTETLARAMPRMQAALALLREAGETAQDNAWLASAVTVVPTAAAAVAGAAFILEAIVEQPDAKRELFAGIDAAAQDDAIFASNTSYLDPFPLIPERRQRRALAVHWYTPPYLIDLVDIAPGPRTDPALVTQIEALHRAMGKVPVVLKRFVPGYIANRIQAAIAAEVYELLAEDVADARAIDDAVIHGLALRIPILGHLAKADFTGLVLLQHALRNATYQPPKPRDRSPELDALVAAGRTGVLSGAGYFDWSGQPPEALFQERDRRLLALKRALRDIGGPLLGR
jgi:3-hydroxybutyryl-CoA dehydrogenase